MIVIVKIEWCKWNECLFYERGEHKYVGRSDINTDILTLDNAHIHLTMEKRILLQQCAS